MYVCVKQKTTIMFFFFTNNFTQINYNNVCGQISTVFSVGVHLTVANRRWGNKFASVHQCAPVCARFAPCCQTLHLMYFCLPQFPVPVSPYQSHIQGDLQGVFLLVLPQKVLRMAKSLPK